MSKNYEVKFEDCFNLPNPGLKSYFDNVRVGQPDEFRTTFARGKSVEEVLNDWKPTVEQLSNEWPSLLDFENDLRSKVGPMSVMKPLSERLDDIDSYYDSILLESQPVIEPAIKAVIAEFKPLAGMVSRGQARTVENMKKSTNSGCPYFTKRRAVTDKTMYSTLFAWYKRGISETDMYIVQGSNHFKYPWDGMSMDTTTWDIAAVLGWRGQEGGPSKEDVKQRVVWMFPYGLNILELQVYQVFIEEAQKYDLVPAWVGMESVDRRITKMFDTKGAEDLVVCTDFSKFDQHFNRHCQEGAYKILSGLLSPTEFNKYWLSHVFYAKYNIPLAYDYGKIRTGAHGMASGSGGTNADETLLHRALQYEAAIKSHSRLNLNSQCLGDDGILTYPGITVEDVVQAYSSHGQEMNVDKQYASKQDCVYLRRWHHQDYRIDGVCAGVYSTYRALGRLMEQERFYDPETWGPKMVALRQLSIIENVKYHPLRDQFAEFCMKRDKYRLGIDIPGFLDNIQTIANEAIELMPDFLGYTKSMQKGQSEGLDSWWIVNFLRNYKK